MGLRCLGYFILLCLFIGLFCVLMRLLWVMLGGVVFSGFWFGRVLVYFDCAGLAGLLCCFDFL